MSVEIIIGDPRIDVSVTAPVASVLPGTPVAREYLDSEPYYGEYEVTPDGGTQTLATTGKRLARDVVVNPAPVTSVNGEVGDVVLDASDVGALPDSTPIPSKVSDLTNDSAFVDAAGAAAAAPVQSVNSKTGTVSLGKSDVGLGNVDNVQQYSASNPPPYPVTSVNSKTGSVTLGKSDIGLGSVDNVKQYSASNPPPYPVSSVNGKIGAVTLKASDVSALPDSTVIPTVPTNVSDFNNDAGYIASESDPVFSASAAAGIDASDILAWNGKSDFSGSYNDLTDKPTIPAASDSAPQDLGTAAAGSSAAFSRADHVHAIPDATDVGALPDTTPVDKVKQNYPDHTQYSYWRPLVVGKAAVNSESGAFSEQTDEVYTFPTVRVQPSSGTIKASKFKGDLEGDVTGMASGNYVLPADGIPASDLEDNYAASHTAGGAAELTVAIPYGEVDSTSTNTTYTATVPGIHELKDGVVCYIRNDVVTSTTNYTINVNGLGAKPVYLSTADATRSSSQFTSASTYLFVYNERRVSGGCWDMYQGTVNSNTIGYQVRTNSTTLPLSDRCYRYRLLFTSADGTKFVPANADTQTSAAKTHTVNTTPIDPFGTIYYYGTTTAKAAGEKVSATILWQQYVITLGYSFNSTSAALTLTPSAPVYIKATPQTDGSAVLDYFTQALPSADDGKIYIFLGVAIDATTVEMQINHPVYYHNGTGIRRWTGGA